MGKEEKKDTLRWKWKKKKKDRMKDRNKSAARLCCDYFNAVLVTQSFFPGYSRKRPITITED